MAPALEDIAVEKLTNTYSERRKASNSRDFEPDGALSTEDRKQLARLITASGAFRTRREGLAFVERLARHGGDLAERPRPPAEGRSAKTLICRCFESVGEGRQTRVWCQERRRTQAISTCFYFVFYASQARHTNNSTNNFFWLARRGACDWRAAATATHRLPSFDGNNIWRVSASPALARAGILASAGNVFRSL